LKSFKHRISLARQLTISDWWKLIEAWGLLLYFNWASRWLSYERLSNQFNSDTDKNFDSSQAAALAIRIHRLVELASHLHLISITCLTRSLTLQRMLKSRNISAKICIGVNKSMEDIHAHAWVEVNGRAIREQEDVSEKFQTLHHIKG
jgi:hypothetical protein